MLWGSPIRFSWNVIGTIFFSWKRFRIFFIYSWFVISHIWFLREREQILGIIRDAWTVSIFLFECILQSGIIRGPSAFALPVTATFSREQHVKYLSDQNSPVILCYERYTLSKEAEIPHKVLLLKQTIFNWIQIKVYLAKPKSGAPQLFHY